MLCLVSREIHFAPQDLNPEVSPTLSATAVSRVEQIAQVKDFLLAYLEMRAGRIAAAVYC